MADLKMPDGKILRFPEGTPDEVLDRAAREYIASNKTASSGIRIIAELPQGGKVFEHASGKRSFSDGSYATSDPAIIEKIMQGATAREVSTEGFDKQTLEQVGLPAGIATQFVRGGGLGSFADEALGAVMGDDAQQAMRATAGAMERQYPKTSLGANVAGGVTSAAGTLAAAPAAVTAAIGKAVAPTRGRLLPMAARSLGAGVVGGE